MTKCNRSTKKQLHSSAYRGDVVPVAGKQTCFRVCDALASGDDEQVLQSAKTWLCVPFDSSSVLPMIAQVNYRQDFLNAIIDVSSTLHLQECWTGCKSPSLHFRAKALFLCSALLVSHSKQGQGPKTLVICSMTLVTLKQEAADTPNHSQLTLATGKATMPMYSISASNDD